MSDKILIVDDEHEIADLVELYLKKRELYGFQILYRQRSIGMYRQV